MPGHRARAKKAAQDSAGFVVDVLDVLWQLVKSGGYPTSPFEGRLTPKPDIESAIWSFAGGIGAALSSVGLYVALRCIVSGQCGREPEDFIFPAAAGVVSLLTAPAALFYGFRTLRRRERGRWLARLGIILSLAPFVVLGAFAYP